MRSLRTLTMSNDGKKIDMLTLDVKFEELSGHAPSRIILGDFDVSHNIFSVGPFQTVSIDWLMYVTITGYNKDHLSSCCRLAS